MSDRSLHGTIKSIIKRPILLAVIVILAMIPALTGISLAGSSELDRMIAEALEHSPEIAAMKAKTDAFRHRIPQAGSLPDPMFMVGYQNMGTRAYTYGDEDSQWMFTASQMFPYPGKLSIKTEMAEKESEILRYETEKAQINLIQKIRETYLDIAFSAKELEIISAKKTIMSKIEELALARYSSGMGMQQDALMAQTEKYMLMENEEMIRAGITSSQAMLSGMTGKHGFEGLPEPVLPSMMTDFSMKMEEALEKADKNFPEIIAKTRMAEASKTRLNMASLEYYPDFTVSAGYGLRGGDNEDMVNVAVTANIPLYLRSKQREGYYEARKMLEQSRHEVEEARIMTAARIRDNYAMLKSYENLANLYKKAIIPKNRQDFDISLASLSTGKTEAAMAMDKLKRLMDSETAYWKNLTGREKTIARIEALACIAVPSRYTGKQNK